MGITSLLPYLKHLITKKKISLYSSKTIAIDGHSWLYQILPHFAENLYYNIPTTKYVDRIKHKLNILKQNNIKPILIFDGDLLPSKAYTNNLRKKKKDKIKEEINLLLKSNNVKRAKELMKQCVSVNSEILKNTITMLKKENVEYIISPYESDAQMCYLQRIGYVDYILTEDSDLIPFGCDKILYKFDGSVVYEFSRDKMNHYDKFFGDNILEICILSGCDYLPSIKGIGLSTAHKLLKEHECYKKVVAKVGVKKQVPENYLNDFERAKVTFKEHIVYDPVKKTRTHLSGKECLDCKDFYEFLGVLEHKDAIKFAIGMNLIEVSGEIEKYTQNIVTVKSNTKKKANLAKNIKKSKVIVDENEYSPFFNRK